MGRVLFADIPLMPKNLDDALWLALCCMFIALTIVATAEMKRRRKWKRHVDHHIIRLCKAASLDYEPPEE